MPFIDPVTQRRAEGVAILLGAIAAWAHLDFSWLVFATCFMLPDLSIAAYLVDRRTGGIVYNLVHCFVWPVAIGAGAVATGSPTLAQIALLWGGHAAFDRALGWGLKFEQSFCHTDMGLKTLPYPAAFLEPPSEMSA